MIGHRLGSTALGAALLGAVLGAGACELPNPEGLARDRPQVAPSPPPSPGPVASTPAALPAAPGAPKPGASAWNPATTRAVIVGVLTFADPAITTFPARHRKDQELADTLIARGVPRENVTVLLDGAATSTAVFEALDRHARAAQPGSALLFYYAGHGSKSEAGEVSFLAFDAGRDTPLAVREIGTVIGRSFRGADVLLMADCCHSGALIDVARELGRGPTRAAAITSAEVSNTSTENWTYTQATIDAFRGDPLSDRDHDGRVALGEWSTEVRDAMKFREGQRAGIALETMPAGYVLATNVAPAPAASDPPAVGSYVTTLRSGTAAVARVVARRPGSATLAFYDYSDFVRTEAPTSALQPVKLTRYAPGSKLRVTWGGRTWDADVLRVDDDFHFITYPGWASSWDEWVASDRIVGTR